MNETVRALWAQTRIMPWPGDYLLVSLPHEALKEAALLAAAGGDQFAALVVEKDEVSLTLRREAWASVSPKAHPLALAGPYRVVTLDLEIDLNVSGYLLPAAERLAQAGIAIVAQCAFRKDHLLIRSEDAETAVSILTRFSAECARAASARK
ncbi:MAG: ACT domain-containing protein [Desulfobacterales bacterium]